MPPEPLVAAGGERTQPSTETKGTERRPTKGSVEVWVILEVVVYIVVAVLVLIALWVNLWVAYYHGGNDLLQRFSADANFILAAAAVLVIAFELRKYRPSVPFEG